MSERKTDYVVRVYRRDLRYREGERLISETRHDNVTEGWIYTYTRAIRAQPGVSRVVYQEQWTTVKNLITGQAVTIRAEDRGGVCDPATESYHSM